MSATIAAPDLGSTERARGSVPIIDYRQLLGLFIASRLAIYTVAAIALRWLPKASEFLPPRTMADWFLRWDALWFLSVILFVNGYWFT